MPKKAPWQRAVRTRAAKSEVVGRGEGADEVAEGEDAHQEEESELALEPGGGDRYDGGADGDGERVASDEDAGFGNADVEVDSEVGQQAHDDELGGADAEGCDSQGHERRVQQDVFAVCNNF